MSFKALLWALSQRTSSAGEKMVLVKLADFANDEGTCYPSMERLAAECDCSPRSAHSYVHGLVELGLLTISKRERTNIYTLNLAREAAKFAESPKQEAARFAGSPPPEKLQDLQNLQDLQLEAANFAGEKLQDLQTNLSVEPIREPRTPVGDAEASILTPEAAIFRQARELLGAAGPKLVGTARKAGVSDADLEAALMRAAAGGIGDLPSYLGGMIRRARAGPPPPRKSHLMAVLDDMIERVRDDERGSVEVREDGHGSIPAAGIARR